MLARECKKELTEHIIPFWDSLEAGLLYTSDAADE